MNMRTTRILLAAALTPGLAAAARAARNGAELFPTTTLFAIDTNNRLLHYSVDAPGELLGAVPVTGLAGPGEGVVAIDFRPSSGQLYALGTTSRIYVVDPVSGAAAAVGEPFTPPLLGTEFGFDFDPQLDQIRIVSNLEQNLRVNPGTGEIVAVDAPITPAGSVVGSAYDSNFAGTPTTVLYAIDSGTDQLYIQDPPNAGTIAPVGPLATSVSDLVGFDIASGTGVAFLSTFVPASVVSRLFTVDLATGSATLVGAFGGATAIGDIAVVTGPELLYALTSAGRLAVFESDDPGDVLRTLSISGLAAGETLVGIDFRPMTGGLYGVGTTNRLYVIDTESGLATPVSASPFAPGLVGSEFGVDFDPQSDRMRVVSDAEQNLRLHPGLGTVAVDASLNPPGNVVAAAYSNNIAGATTTTLYILDSDSDLLLTQDPPDNGTLNPVGALGVAFSALAGFDIGRQGFAFAALTAPPENVSSLYRVDLATGEAALVGEIGGGATVRDLSARLHTEVAHAVFQTKGGTFNLSRFNPAVPGQILSSVAITGLEADELILGIDIRPETGGLYAIGSTNRLYRLDPATGAASAVGGPFTPALLGTSFGVDFDPLADLIRVVSDAEQNLRLDPDTGAVSSPDPALAPAGNVVAAAYRYGAAGGSTLFDVDSDSDMLLVQVPENLGVLTPVGALGVDLGPTVGFDIVRQNGSAYVAGSLPLALSPTLFRASLLTGELGAIGVIGTFQALVGLAVTFEGENPLFVDGFESGGVARWTDTFP